MDFFKNVLMKTFDPNKNYNDHEWRILSRSIFHIQFNNLINLLNLPDDIKSNIKNI